MSDESRKLAADRFVPIVASFIVSVAAGVLVLAFEKELRALSRKGALVLAATLLAIALIMVMAPALRRLSTRLSQLPGRIAFLTSETLLYLAPLLFVIATLVIVYASKPLTEDFLTFLEPFGPVLAGCGGAISIVAAAASDVVYRRDVVWKQIRFESMTALFLVVCASGFNRFGYTLESWGVGVAAMNFGIFDVHRRFFAVASLFSDPTLDSRRSRSAISPKGHPGRKR